MHVTYILYVIMLQMVIIIVQQFVIVIHQQEPLDYSVQESNKSLTTQYNYHISLVIGDNYTSSFHHKANTCKY